jgi:glycosyltransferase involved in cell wall biosynthesis
VLVVINNIWPPPVLLTGVSILYECQKKLALLGHEVHLLTSIGVWDKCSSRSNIDELYDVKSWHQTQEQLFKVKFHTYDLSRLKKWPRLAFYINRLLPLIFIPYLHFKHRFNVIHEYTSTPALIYRSYLLKTLLSTRLYHTIIAEIPTIMGSHSWLKFLTPKLDKIICTNKNIHHKFRAVGYSLNDLSLVPLGVDFEKFEKIPGRLVMKKKYGFDQKKTTVLFLGPLENHKGYKVFMEGALKALEKVNDILFVLATYDSPDINLRAYGERKNEILSLINSFPENFKILEGIHNVTELMAFSDFIVLPQISIDGATAHPVTMLEGMASKRPVIVSDLKALKELIIHKETGYLFNTNDPGNLSEVLLEAINESSLNEQIALNGYNLIRSKYRIEKIASSIEAIYAE